MCDKTLEYYEKNAEAFASGTAAVDFSKNQNRFLAHIAPGGVLLDLGCGSGRDTKAFLERGYRVDAVDGSAKMCRIAGEYTRIEVRQLRFQELTMREKYDGIWACASILHLPKKELGAVFKKMAAALKAEGWIYTSFKYGTFEGERNGRYFTDFTLEDFETFVDKIEALIVREAWITGDVRPGRGDEKWLNLMLQKK